MTAGPGSRPEAQRPGEQRHEAQRRRRPGVLGGSRWTFAVRVPGAPAVAIVALASLVLAALAADVLRPEATAVNLDAVLRPPSLEHPLGTDETGRDLLGLTLRAVRTSLTVAFLAACVALSIGVTVGVLAGTLGGWVDSALMRLVDFFASQNHFLFGLLLVVLFRPIFGAAGAVMLAVGVSHWFTVARIIRGELLALRERPFIAAAVGGGTNRVRLVTRHVLPHVLPSALVALILLFPHAIFHESALSFLGVGMPPHDPSLGNLIAAGQHSLLAGSWWPTVFPGLFILVATVSFGTIGEWIRDRMQPKWRAELEL